jgi:hypothetical protein
MRPRGMGDRAWRLRERKVRALKRAKLRKLRRRR